MCNSHRRMTAPRPGSRGSTKAPLFPSNDLSQTKAIGYNTVRDPLLSCDPRDIACHLRALGVGGAAAWPTGGHG
jgi:hypothetical protein